MSQLKQLRAESWRRIVSHEDTVRRLAETGVPKSERDKQVLKMVLCAVMGEICERKHGAANS